MKVWPIHCLIVRLRSLLKHPKRLSLSLSPIIYLQVCLLNSSQLTLLNGPFHSDQEVTISPRTALSENLFGSWNFYIQKFSATKPSYKFNSTSRDWVRAVHSTFFGLKTPQWLKLYVSRAYMWMWNPCAHIGQLLQNRKSTAGIWTFKICVLIINTCLPESVVSLAIDLWSVYFGSSACRT